MKTITIMASSINDLSVEIENFKRDNEIISLTYMFNTIEYYKNMEPYCQAIIEYKN